MIRREGPRAIRYGTLEACSESNGQAARAARREGEQIDASLYNQAIGSLMYLAVGTRPDIAFAVSRLAQYVEHPSHSLWVSFKRVLRYLRGTKDVGIKYSSSSSINLVAFSDSDKGGCKIKRKSTSGYGSKVGERVRPFW